MADTLTKMLERVDSSYDKSEGSIFHDVLAPVGKEYDEIHKKADEILDRRLIDTARGEDLDRAAGEFGIDRKLAQFAEGKVVFSGRSGTLISAGALVASESVVFYTKYDCIINETGNAVVDIVCVTPGIVGNVGAGHITRLPVTLAGVDSVTNDEATSGGYDEETDDELRERTYFAIRAPRGSGNKNDYINWAMSVDGVGGVRVTPLWAGAGTVKVVIVDSNGKAADDALISKTAAYIETERPIGAKVTVVSAVTKYIDISCKLVLVSDSDSDVVHEAITKAISEYLQTFSLSSTNISYAKIGATILDVDGVDDYSGLLINGDTSNIVLGIDEVPVIGTVDYGA